MRCTAVSAEICCSRRKENPAGLLQRGFLYALQDALALKKIPGVGIKAVAAWDDITERIITGTGVVSR